MTSSHFRLSHSCDQDQHHTSFRECRLCYASPGRADFVVDHGSVSIAEVFTGTL